MRGHRRCPDHSPKRIATGPGCAGIGLRAPHHDEFLDRRPAVSWVEVHSENFFADGGRQLEVLEAVRRDYALSLHGVGLSLGSADPLDAEHLRRLKRLVDRFEPALVSEHVSWSSVDGLFLNDLLPLPLDAGALDHMVTRVGQMQDFLGREVLVENVSSYLQPGCGGDDRVGVSRGTRAALRLPACSTSTTHVNAVNHGFDAERHLAAVPPGWSARSTSPATAWQATVRPRC